MLTSLFSSEARILLLKLFLLNPKDRFYMRQIEAKLSKPLSSLQKELYGLEKIGILKSEREGNLKYFFLNEACPIYPDLKNIFLKTEALGAVIRENLKEVDQIHSAFIYGSIARGEEQLTSDIDLMILGDVDLDNLHELITNTERDLNREINYTVFDMKEVAKRLKSKDSFLITVLKEPKIMLIGTDNDFQKIIERKSDNSF